jgi:hypothetical protein
MSLGNVGSGFGYYSAYSCPGLPHVDARSISGVYKFAFPSVSQEVRVTNLSSGSMKVGFTLTSFAEGHSLTLLSSGTLEFPIRVADVYVSGSGSVEVFAALSVVNRLEMPQISGSFLTGV